LARRALVAVVLGTCALLPGTAQAGTYDVYSCKFGSSFYGNNAWTPVNASLRGDPSFSAPDVTCTAPGDPLTAILRAANFGRGVSSQLQFAAPLNTRISDYTVDLTHRYSVTGSANPAGGTYRNNDPGVVAYVTSDKHYWGAGPVTKTVSL
jgi:hypothetical protein